MPFEPPYIRSQKNFGETNEVKLKHILSSAIIILKYYSNPESRTDSLSKPSSLSCNISLMTKTEDMLWSTCMPLSYHKIRLFSPSESDQISSLVVNLAEGPLLNRRLQLKSRLASFLDCRQNHHQITSNCFNSFPFCLHLKYKPSVDSERKKESYIP